MKNFICLIITVVGFHAFGQIARTTYIQDQINDVGGAFIEKHPTNGNHFVAAMKLDDSNSPYTGICALDSEGKLVWHTEIVHPDFTSLSAVCDILVDNSNIYVYSYLFKAPLTDARARIYKLDLTGALLDSADISNPGGIAIRKSEMAFDTFGGIFTTYKTGQNVHYVNIETGAMSILADQFVFTTTSGSTNHIRSAHCAISGSDRIIVLSKADQVHFLKVDVNGVVLSNDSLVGINGEVVDFEVVNGNYLTLINKEFASSTPADNPIRLIECQPDATVISDDSYVPSTAHYYTDFCVDSNGDVYVVGTKQSSTLPPYGGVFKISNSIDWEQTYVTSRMCEIEMDNGTLFASGFDDDPKEECFVNDAGYTFVKFKSSQLPLTEVVSPHMMLKVNNVEALISYNSNNFRDLTTGQAAFETIGAGGSTIYNSSLWMGSVDADSNVVYAGGLWTGSFGSGPVTNSSDYDLLERDKWDRVWKITRQEIDDHILAFQTGNASYVIPEVILNWPVHGDIAKGQKQNITRFKDTNGNGTYEPELGDYPSILGDYCILAVYNNVNHDVEESCIVDPEKLKIQVYEYHYGFECDPDSALQKTIYAHYEVFNETGEDQFEAYIGSFEDFDIHLSFDDYIGSDPSRGMLYAMNGSAPGPEQCLTILGSNVDEDTLDNAFGPGLGESVNGLGYGDGVIDNERLGMTNSMWFNLGGSATTGEPSSAGDFYNYLQSRWKDGTHLTQGGNGYMSSSIETNHIFQGMDDPLWSSTGGIDPGSFWSEAGEANPEGDRRGLGSSGPFTFGTNDTVKYDIAFVTGVESVSGGYTSHEALQFLTDSARSYYAQNLTPCGTDFDWYEPFDGPYTTIGMVDLADDLIRVFPNPSNGNFTVNLGSTGEDVVAVIYALDGRIVLNESLGTTQQFDLNVTEADGVYLLVIHSNQGMVRKKIVKE